MRTHLRAFAPARPADVAQWVGLTVTHLRNELARIDGLVRHEDEEGRELVDLAGRPPINLEPFGALGAADRAELEIEGERLAMFIEAREPAVYARYRHTRRRG